MDRSILLPYSFPRHIRRAIAGFESKITQVVLDSSGRKVRASQSAVPANGRGSGCNVQVTESATENIPLSIFALEEEIGSKGEKAR